MPIRVFHAQSSSMRRLPRREGLLAPDCSHRVQPGSPNCRQTAGDPGNKPQEQGRRCERRRIGSAHLKQHPADRARRSQRRRNPNEQSRHRESQALPHHKREHIAPACAQRQPHAKFLRPLAHGVAHHAVQPDRRQYQAHHSHHTQEGGRDPLGESQRRLGSVFHAAGAKHRVRVQRQSSPAQHRR